MTTLLDSPSAGGAAPSAVPPVAVKTWLLEAIVLALALLPTVVFWPANVWVLPAIFYALRADRAWVEGDATAAERAGNTAQWLLRMALYTILGIVLLFFLGWALLAMFVISLGF